MHRRTVRKENAETGKGVSAASSSELRRNLGPKAAHLLVSSAGAGGGSSGGWGFPDPRPQPVHIQDPVSPSGTDPQPCPFTSPVAALRTSRVTSTELFHNQTPPPSIQSQHTWFDCLLCLISGSLIKGKKMFLLTLYTFIPADLFRGKRRN